MRSTLWRAVLAAGALVCTTTLPASEVEHYSGKEAKTLEQAVTNLREYNRKLGALVAKNDLAAGELEQVHRLTYTLENALERIRSELAGMAGDLETVHQASERREADTVRKHGKAFLDQSRTLAGE